MSARTVVLELAGENKLARDLVAGGVFVPGESIPLNEECELVLRDSTNEIRARAMVVFANDDGIGLQLHDCNAEMKQRIAALGTTEPAPATDLAPTEVAADDAPPPPADATDDDAGTETSETADGDAAPGDDKKQNGNVHERLRGLTLAQQIKLAHHGEVSERVVLERLYGKAVWEALLRNPRLTGPEVARIARMGSLPRPLMEIIVGNGGWLQIPEVRRALLTNPRLATDQILRILRLLPKHELKMASMQTIYPMVVRDQAKKLIKEAGGG